MSPRSTSSSADAAKGPRSEFQVPADRELASPLTTEPSRVVQPHAVRSIDASPVDEQRPRPEPAARPSAPAPAERPTVPEPAERPVSPDSQRTPTQLQRRWRHDARLVVLLLASVAAVLILPFLLQRRAPPSGDATEQLVASLDRTSGVLPSSWMAHPWSATRVPAASLGRAARSVRLGVLGVDLELLLAGEDSLAAAAAGQMAMLLAEMPASAPTARRDSAFFGSRVLRLTSRRLARIPDLASELSAALRDASVVPESPAAWQGLERRVALLELAPTRSISENRWSDRGGTRRMRR